MLIVARFVYTAVPALQNGVFLRMWHGEYLFIDTNVSVQKSAAFIFSGSENLVHYVLGITPHENLSPQSTVFGINGKAIPVQPWGFQEVEAARFQDNRHMKVVRLSAIRTGRLYPQAIFMILISLRGWVDPRAIVRPEELWQWRITVTPLGNRTLDLPACSAVPQPTAPPRAPVF